MSKKSAKSSISREHSEIQKMIAKSALMEADGWVQFLRHNMADFFSSKDEIVSLISDFIVQLCNKAILIGSKLNNQV